MDATKLAAIVGLLVALSAASERLVEIVKGLSRWLDEKKARADEERKRKAVLQTMAVAAGILTALAASPALPADLLPESGGLLGRFVPLIALGFLASGGSGLWNSVLTYVLKVKDIKEAKETIVAAIAADAKSDPGRRADVVGKLAGI